MTSQTFLLWGELDTKHLNSGILAGINFYQEKYNRPVQCVEVHPDVSISKTALEKFAPIEITHSVYVPTPRNCHIIPVAVDVAQQTNQPPAQLELFRK